MKWLPFIFLSAATTAAPLIAQNNCEPGKAEAILQGNEVRASLYNNGQLFWNREQNEETPRYQVPSDSHVNAILAASFMMGGMVDGELRVAAARYGDYEWWPGPLGSTVEDCLEHDRIYSVSKEDLNNWNTTGHSSRDMEDWPWHLGAPVLDGDGIGDNYDLTAGDSPALLGDHMLWWIMNDASGIHESYDTMPMEVEVIVSAFASELLEFTTFYKYDITYMGASPLEQAFVSLFVDGDLGQFHDDYVGTDTTLGMAYMYNADNLDEESDLFHNTYGENPPAFGVLFLDAPVRWKSVYDSHGEIDQQKSNYLTATSHYFNHELGDQPYRLEYLWNNVRGRWSFGEVQTEGGIGLGFSEREMPFAYPGKPGEYWSELNYDGKGNGNLRVDRSFMATSWPYELESGESTTFYFAIVWSRGSSNLDSVRQLKKDAAIVKQVAPTLLKPIYSYDPETPPEPEYSLGANEIFPNPAAAQASLEYSLPQSMRVRLEIFDVLGRRVHDSGDAVCGAGEYTARFDTSGWPAGVYTARLQLDHITTTRTFTVVR